MRNSGYLTALPTRDVEDADPNAADALRRAEAKFGFVPRLYGGMANVPALLTTFLEAHERFRRDSVFSPMEQEVIFLTLGWEHASPYTMAMHSAIADQESGLPKPVIEAIRYGGLIDDPKLSALHETTRIMLRSRGRPTQAKIAPFFDAGYGDRHLLEIVLAISLATLSSYCDHLMQPKLDEAYSRYAWEPV